MTERESPTRFHSLERTSPKGERFIGVCVLCGQEGLTIADARQECSNVTVTADQAVLDALGSSPDD